MFCPECDSILKPTRFNIQGDSAILLACVECSFKIKFANEIDNFILRDVLKNDKPLLIEIVDQSSTETRAISRELREEIAEQFRESRLNGN